MLCPHKVALVCLGFTTIGPVLAQQAPVPAVTLPAISAQTANAADTPLVKAGDKSGAVLRAQVLLDRAGFSPGVLDGSFGTLAVTALKAFQRASGLKPTGTVDPQTWAKLKRDDLPTLVRLVVSGNDAAGPYINPIPADMMAKAKLPALHYSSAWEALAEKFHTTPDFLKLINPGVTQLSPGTLMLVPNVRGVPDAPADGVKVQPAGPRPMRDWAQVLNELSVAPDQPKAVRVVVDKSDKTVQAFDAGGKLIAHFPATIGSKHDPLPLGRWKINGVSKLPPFQYNPDLFWDAKASHSKAKIPPGPNSPVGVVWIDLSKPHYGIHGTPEPSTISRTESHGCVRLANWDAAKLAQMVSPGTAAILQD